MCMGFTRSATAKKTAQFFQLLDIADMYNSWWFLGLLGLFSFNLIVCSLERIPQVFRLLRRDNLALKIQQLHKMPLRKELDLGLTFTEALEKIDSFMQQQGLKGKSRDTDEGRLYCVDKCGWSRLGVYVVHLSILVILAGAIVGSSAVAKKILHRPTFAFKGALMLPEGQSIDHVTTFGQGTFINLDFTLRCDDFTIEYYPNGMPKTYRSQVTILEGDKVLRQAQIEVNKPLTYRGVTLYQSSYQPLQQYQIHIQRESDGVSTAALGAAAEELAWPQADVSYGIINRENQGEVTKRLKIWFSDHQGAPSIFWINAGQEARIERPNGSYRFKAEQAYATGLQATKDPGVGLVYGGCMLMLVGLYVAFFLSHRRIWIMILDEGTECRILLAGDANKNKVGFEKKFSLFIKRLEQFF